MSQVQINPYNVSADRKAKRAGSNQKIEANSTDTSSKSKPEVEEESSSSSDRRGKNEMPPVQPPPTKVISKINQDDSSSVKKGKTVKKSDKSATKKKSNRSAEEAAIEPAPGLILGAGDDDTPQEEKKRKRKRVREKGSGASKKSVKRRAKKSKGPSDAASFAPQLSRSIERFDDSKSVAVKRRPVLSGSSERTPLQGNKNQSGLSKSQFAFDASSVRSKSKKNDTLDDAYVTILTIPTEAPEPLPKSSSKPAASSKKAAGKLPPPVLPSVNDHGDGLMPIETVAETIEPQTNVFRADKYDGAVNRRKPGHEADMSQPVAGWLKFQVPIVPKPDDVQFERQATKQFDISRLLHQAKTC